MSKGKSGEKHVYWNAAGKAWKVEIRMKNGDRVALGRKFKTVAEAVKARDAYLRLHKAGAGVDQRGREGFRYIYTRMEYADKGVAYSRYVVLITDRKTGKLTYIGSSRDIDVAVAIRDAYLAKQK